VTSLPAGKRFGDLAPEQQDGLLRQWEAGDIVLPNVNPKAFFSLVLGNVREGFFADPIYGGNKDMASWKMLGFPGAQYDFREAIGKRGQVLEIKPVSLIRKKV
jgi:gluconate 2-dehydrogenase gamma chain